MAARGPAPGDGPAGITSAAAAGEARQLAARPPRGSMAWSRRAGRTPGALLVLRWMRRIGWEMDLHRFDFIDQSP